jgi:hypothetical protein
MPVTTVDSDRGDSVASRSGGQRLKKWIIRGCIAMALLMAVGYAALCALFYVPESEKVHRALDLARLADLPKDAVQVKADGFANLFTMSYYLHFDASRESIRKFIADSPGLEGVVAEPFVAQEWPQGSMEPRFPWFNPNVITRGRTYHVPKDLHAAYGTLYVDDDTNTVFVTSGRS